MANRSLAKKILSLHETRHVVQKIKRLCTLGEVMEIKTLENNSKTFEVYELKRYVVKVEKWSTTETISETIVSGGGGRISTGLDGKVYGKIEKTNVGTRHVTKSHVNTRLYLDNGEHFTFPNSDVITMEGNEVYLVAYAYDGMGYIGAIQDKKTGFSHQFFKPKHFLEEIVKVKPDQGNAVWYALFIALGIIAFAYYQLTSWEWWSWPKYIALGLLTFAMFFFVDGFVNGPKDQTVQVSDFESALSDLNKMEADVLSA